MGAESVVLDYIPQETVDFLTSTPMLVGSLAAFLLAMAIKGSRRQGSGKAQRKGSRKQGIDRRPPYQRPGYSGPVPEPKPAKK